jgi:death on curing protein
VSKPLTHLTASAVKAIHAEVLAAHGGSPGIRDEALLESAVAAPQATMMGETLMSDPIEIGAAYLFYLCRNHAFVDGNKRTALAACLVFLESNDLLPNAKLPTTDWEAFVLDVAASRLDREQTTARLRKLLKYLRTSKAKKE